MGHASAAARVAALYDIHGNLPALEAVLRAVRNAGVDLIVVGGDVIPGPMPRQTLEYLLHLNIPRHFIVGNGELAVLAQIGVRAADVTYWGTTSGHPLSAAVQEQMRWNADQIRSDYEATLRSWSKTIRISIDGLGEVLFCHGTPRSKVECVTKLTPEAQLVPVLQEIGAELVVCGHTHMQFDRMIGSVRMRTGC